MSRSEIAKRAGSIGAASGAVLTRRREPSAELAPVKPQRCLQARHKEPLALRRVEPRPAFQSCRNQIDAPHSRSL
jgi:hypothetical protein